MKLDILRIFLSFILLHTEIRLSQEFSPWCPSANISHRSSTDGVTWVYIEVSNMTTTLLGTQSPLSVSVTIPRLQGMDRDHYSNDVSSFH